MSTSDRPSQLSSDLPPWQVHPSLTRDRLLAVDRLIREARHEVVLLHEPTRGDTPWVLGCRAFQWVIHRIAKASFGEYADWLQVVEGGEWIDETDELVLRLHFVFAIGDVPMRFYRGLPDDVPARYLRCRYPELAARQTAFDFVGTPEMDDVFRIAVETDELGEVERTVLVQVSKNGEPHHAWPIESEVMFGTVAQFRPKREEEKQIGRPTVRRRTEKEEGPAKGE